MAANCKNNSRPKPAEVSGMRITVVCGPKDGRWYWRGRRKGQRDTVWTGGATRNEAMAEVARLVTRGLPEAAQTSRAELRSVHDQLAAMLDRQERVAPTSNSAPWITTASPRGTGSPGSGRPPSITSTCSPWSATATTTSTRAPRR